MFRYLGAMVVWLWAASAQAADLDAGMAAVNRGDYVEALRQFEPLAQQDNSAAQVNMGTLYLKGLGVEQDYEKAREWFQRAAEQNDPLGQAKLGIVYFYGLGVPADTARGIEWFRKAAEQDEVTGQTILGSLYATGEALPQDLVQAHFWLSLAAAQGHQAALDAREGLVEHMTPGQIQESQALAADWYERHRPAGASRAADAKPAAAQASEAGSKKRRKPRSSGPSKSHKRGGDKHSSHASKH